MNQKQNESLSALMDGELDEISLHRLLKSDDGAEQEAMRETWARYHIARDAMKGEVDQFTGVDISGSISAALDDEAAFNERPMKEKAASWWKPVAGMSVAASVAFAVVLGARFGGDGLTQDHQIAAKPEVKFVTPEVTKVKGPTMVAEVPVNGEEQKELQQAQERLNSYLKQHAQDSAIGQGRTAMPFARVVNFETNQPNQSPVKPAPKQ